MDEFTLPDGGFDAAYEGAPPWEIGRPQPLVVEWAGSGSFAHRVLDVGCGTGENARFLAGRGHRVVGVDAAARAIERAREKADERGFDGDGDVDFHVHDARSLSALSLDPFETVVDSGLFHVFDDADRARYVQSVRDVMAPGGRVHLVCFSDDEPGDWGPRRVSEAELRAAFADGWTVVTLERTRFALTTDRGWVHAWECVVERQ